MKKLTLIVSTLLLLCGQNLFAKDDHHNNGKKKSISAAVAKLFRHHHKRPKAGQIITWNGQRWVPVQYALWDNPGDGSQPGDQFIWDGHRWIAHSHQGGNNNSIEITAGVGLLANGQAGGVITDIGVLDINIGTSAGQIPFINDDGDMAVDGFLVSGDGIIFPDGSVQNSAAGVIQGPAGPQGPAGVAGADGAVGPQGPAGADGAVGPQGPAGIAGAQGPAGPQGPAGVAGVDGAVGPQGPAGIAGADGAVGPQGPAGIAGAKGDKGDKGDQGVAGAVGPQGPAGVAGADGAVGPQGPIGPAGSDATVSITAGVGILGDAGGSSVSSTGNISVDVGINPGQIAQVGADGKLSADILPAASGSSSLKIAFLKDIKPSGTAGGTCTAGTWQTRDLNAVEGDSEIISLAANSFTLQPGRYEIDGIIPAFLSSQHKTRLVNASGATVIIGSTGFSNSGAASMTQSDIKGTFSLTSAATFHIEHRCGTGHPYGFGYPSGFGVDEVYSQVKIVKID